MVQLILNKPMFTEGEANPLKGMAGELLSKLTTLMIDRMDDGIKVTAYLPSEHRFLYMPASYQRLKTYLEESLGSNVTLVITTDTH